MVSAVLTAVLTDSARTVLVIQNLFRPTETSMMNNPALHEVSRSQPASPIPLQRDASILDWLEGTGRLLARESAEPEYQGDEAEITELMSGDDNSFDVDDDDDDSLDLDD
jgi:hypothetical protein